MKLSLSIIKKTIPRSIFLSLQKPYHYTLALLGALYYRFPSKDIFVVGITGTKGKSSVIELINSIFEEAGLRTALQSTIRFKIGDESHRNLYKMTMPGRFFMQKFLRDAVSAGCRYAILEMTSEGVTQFRHKYIELDALIFTNITPEHIESHGSFKNYLAAKLELANLVQKSQKRKRTIIANVDDPHGKDFLAVAVEQKLPYSLSNAHPHNIRDNGIALTVEGTYIMSPLRGEFNVYNMLAAISFARSQRVPMETIKRALEKLTVIPGRVEYIHRDQPFTVVVDYAHTPDSLEKLYQVFEKDRKICVLGNAGGGRDTWKRPVMAALAEKYCEKIILTNEDPYDEEPQTIIDGMLKGFKKKVPDVILDRRESIAKAFSYAEEGDVVLITGKGTDPYILWSGGYKEPWSDAAVASEELEKLFSQKI